MNEKLLIVADSALELLLSIQVKLTLYRESEATLIITDRSSKSENVFRKMKELSVFNKVIYVKANDLLKFKIVNHLPNKIKIPLYKFFNVLKAKKVINGEKYTIFISSEIDHFSRYMYLAIKKNAKAYLIGEGIFPFAGLSEFICEHKTDNNAEFLRQIKRIYYYGNCISTLSNYEMIQIPSINNNRTEFVNILNHLYDYRPKTKVYTNKIIFFEESYSRDGGKDNAVAIVTQLIDTYGADKIAIKRHPRGNINRFEHLNIEMIEPYYIPWELIVLNGDCKDCILLSANSGSVYLCKIWDLCTNPVECFMLNKIMRYESPVSYISTYLDTLKQLYDKYNIICPETEEKMLYYISETMKKWK